LKINSNSSSHSTLNLPLSGSLEDITALNVRINQVGVVCPSGVVTAYVSVTDQGGYPVTVLTKDDFSITETGGYSGAPVSSPFVEDNNATLSVALALDYSSSVTVEPEKLNDMREGATSFINQLGVDDEAEMIKFSSVIEVIQPFTSDKNLLLSAIDAPFPDNSGTALYKAGQQGVRDTYENGTKDRKAVILITDGVDTSSIGIDVPYLIDYALDRNIPLFTIGLGDYIDVDVLKNLADGTGGQYYAASTSDNLQTVYQQLADVLFSYQYILTYTSGLGSDLTVEATLGSIIGNSNTKSITPCP